MTYGLPATPPSRSIATSLSAAPRSDIGSEWERSAAPPVRGAGLGGPWEFSGWGILWALVGFWIPEDFGAHCLAGVCGVPGGFGGPLWVLGSLRCFGNPWCVLGPLAVSGGFWWFLVGLGVLEGADSGPHRGRPLLPLGQSLLDTGPGLPGPSGPSGPLGAPTAPSLRRGLRGSLVVPQLPLCQPERALRNPPRSPGTRVKGCHREGDWGGMEGPGGALQGGCRRLGGLWEWIEV